MSEQNTERTDEDPRTGALPGGGDSQYGNDTGFADEALADETGAGPDAQPSGDGADTAGSSSE